MECNRDDAQKAMEVAEKKFRSNDPVSAKKFALKAQSLFPDLENISHMIAILDIHLSAEEVVNGDKNWHGILCVEASADYETAKKSYKNLARILHPDRNKLFGAEAAFKLLSEAWSVLKRNINQESVSSNVWHHTSIPTANVSCQMNTADSVPPSVPPPVSSTFWTSCSHCKMQYEHLIVYLNQNLLCHTCKRPFLAVEIEYAFNVRFSYAKQRQQDPTDADIHDCTHKHNQSVDKSWGVGQENKKPKSQTDKSICEARMPWKQGSILKRDLLFIDIQNMLMQTGNFLVKNKINDLRSTIASKLAEKEEVEQKKKLMEDEIKIEKITSRGDAENVVDETPVRKSSSENSCVGSDSDKETMQPMSIDVPDSDGDAENLVDEIPVKAVRNLSSENLCVDSDSDKVIMQPMLIDVPDSDFHDFDMDRSENSFKPDQIWATYDDEDGMPRFYCLIQTVISSKPFKLCISFLNSETDKKLGLTKICGDFRVGRFEISEHINIFSHVVRWVKGRCGVIKIFPRKGDVWALYKNWLPNWNDQTPKDMIYLYEMVEVVDDHNEQGLLVSPLLKVDGLKTVFHRHPYPKVIMKIIPRKEMSRFSHQVPSYLLTGMESENAPKGCHELDPAACPLEFNQVITESKKLELGKSSEKQLGS